MLSNNRLGLAALRSLYFIFVFTVLVAPAYPSAHGDSNESLKAGHEAFSRKEFRQALQHFREAVKESPTNLNAQRRLAYMAAVLGEAEEALSAYQDVARLKPSPKNSYQLGWFAGELGETAIAVKAFQDSLSYSWRDRFFQLLKAIYRDSEWEEVAEIVEATPNQVAQRLFRVYLEAEDRNQALSFARSRGWVRDGVDYCDPPFWLRISYKTAGLLAILTHPEHADCSLQVGKDLTDNGDYRLARFLLVDLVRYSERREIRDKAEAFIRHRLPAHDISKRTEWLHGVGAVLKSRFKMLDEALKAFQRSIAADPRFAQPYYRIGYIYWRKDNDDEAVSWYRKALAIQSDHWRATYGMGCVLRDQMKYNEALPYFQKAVELNPEDESSFYNIGRVFSGLNRYNEALPAYRRAVALDPNDAYNRWGLSWVLHKLGREEEAKKEWAMAVKLKPSLSKKTRR